MSLTVKAYAKINLWLDITGKLCNGYHSLNTVMKQIDLYDIVTINKSDRITVSTDCSGINGTVPDNEKNIAYRAAELFFEMLGGKDGAEIQIVKQIPLEGGLGGSSTDGAAVLKALNMLYGEPFTLAELSGHGSFLGADVPFGIVGGTAVCRGIGDIIEPVECADFAVAVIKPDFSCNTGLAFRSYDNNMIDSNPYFEEYCKCLGDCFMLSRNMYNVFEKLHNNAEIYNIKKQLIESGAYGALMSGSGSSVFGIFENIAKAEKALDYLDYKCKFAVKTL